MRDDGLDGQAAERTEIADSLSCRDLRVRRLRFALALTLVVAFAGSAAAVSAVRPPPTKAKLEQGRTLYRKYCGQCHALKEALAVGFGQAKLKTDPGPSLNSLRVNWNLCVQAIVLAIGGHETIQSKMSWQEIDAVSSFVEQATKTHPIPAKITGADFTPVLGPKSK